MEFRLATNALADKVTNVCLDFGDLVELIDRLTREEAIGPGIVLCLIGFPADRKKGFFLEVVRLWDRI